MLSTQSHTFRSAFPIGVFFSSVVAFSFDSCCNRNSQVSCSRERRWLFNGSTRKFDVPLNNGLDLSAKDGYLRHVFAKHNTLYLVMRNPRPFCFPLWKKNTFTLRVVLFVFCLNFIFSRWTIGTTLRTLIFSFLSLREPKVQEAHWHKQSEIHSMTFDTCFFFVQVQVVPRPLPST